MNKLILFVFGIFMISLAFAQVPTFHQFYGEVRNVTGSLVLNSFTINAYINGNLVGTTIMSGGNYGYNPVFFAENGEDGEIISFYINNSFSKNYTFANEESTELNLIYNNSAPVILYCGDSSCNNGETCSSCSLDCGNCPVTPPDNGNNNGGGGGGGGGGGTPRTNNTTKNNSVNCISQWSCGEWSSCADGKQTRECIDIKNCNQISNMPEIEQACKSITTSQTETPAKTSAGFNLSAFMDKYWLYFIAAIIMLVVLIVIGFRKVLYQRRINNLKKSIS